MAMQAFTSPATPMGQTGPFGDPPNDSPDNPTKRLIASAKKEAMVSTTFKVLTTVVNNLSEMQDETWYEADANFKIVFARIANFQTGEVEHTRIMQMARPHGGERMGHHLPHARLLLLPLVQHLLHRHALQPVLAAAEIAGDNRERHRLGKLRQIVFRRRIRRGFFVGGCERVDQKEWRH